MRRFVQMRCVGLAGVSLFAALLVRSSQAQLSLAAVLPVVDGPRASTPVAPPASAQAALQSMFAEAGVVFTGEVASISRDGDAVVVRFRVDDAVRGVADPAGYTLREWAGLWVGGARYEVGQRLLMLLYAPSAMGFSSPVGGLDGAVPVAGDVADGVVDLRWVAARVLQRRPVAVAAASTSVAPFLPAASPSSSDVPAGSSSGDAMARADRGVVMGLLHAWQRSAVVAK